MYNKLARINIVIHTIVCKVNSILIAICKLHYFSSYISDNVNTTDNFEHSLNTIE